MVPESARTIPKSTFIKVLLPDPFSPRSPTILPGGIVRSMLWLARTRPYRLQIPRISSMRTKTRSLSADELDSAARILAGHRDLQLAGRKLFLERFELGNHLGRNHRIEFSVLRIAQLGAGAPLAVQAV